MQIYTTSSSCVQLDTKDKFAGNVLTGVYRQRRHFLPTLLYMATLMEIYYEALITTGVLHISTNRMSHFNGCAFYIKSFLIYLYFLNIEDVQLPSCVISLYVLREDIFFVKDSNIVIFYWLLFFKVL